MFWLRGGHCHSEHTAAVDNRMRPTQDLQHSTRDGGGDREVLPLSEEQMVVKQLGSQNGEAVGVIATSTKRLSYLYSWPPSLPGF